MAMLVEGLNNTQSTIKNREYIPSWSQAVR